MRSLALSSIVLLVACGAAAPAQVEEPESAPTAPASDSAAFLLDVGGTLTDLLARPSEPIEALDAARRGSRGADRRQRERDLARAHLYAAEETTGRDSRRHLREAAELAHDAAAATRVSTLIAELDFIQLWCAWRAGQDAAEGRAERFVTRHDEAGDLTLLAWVVRGEIAFEHQRWDDAIEAYRAVLGHLEHPLYAFALYRTARARFQDGREEDAHHLFEDVQALGCPSNASATTLHVALEATHALSGATRTDAEGRERPASCPEEAVAVHSIEDERPPPVVR